MMLGQSLRDEQGEVINFSEEGFTQIFKLLDVDNDGLISRDEMSKYLQSVC